MRFMLLKTMDGANYRLASGLRFQRYGEIMRWIVRDFGVFLYGCVFACKYFVVGQDAHQPGKQDLKCCARVRPILVVQKR